MNKFQESELKGRELFQSFLKYIKPEQSYPTLDKFNPVDYYFIKSGVKIMVEIKVRNQRYENYPFHLIELNKYCNMFHEKIEKKCQSAIYCNFFGDNVLYVYDLKNISTQTCNITNKYCNVTTAEDNGSKWKPFFELKTNLADIFIRQDGEWKLVRRSQI